MAQASPTVTAMANRDESVRTYIAASIVFVGRKDEAANAASGERLGRAAEHYTWDMRLRESLALRRDMNVGTTAAEPVSTRENEPGSGISIVTGT